MVMERTGADGQQAVWPGPPSRSQTETETERESHTRRERRAKQDDDAWEVLRRVGSSPTAGSLLAVVDAGNPDGASRAYSYRQLWCRCASAAGFFAGTHAPVQPGDRIAVLLENCPAYMEMHFVAAGLRATLVNLNYRLAAPELAYILSNSEPSWLVAHVSYRRVLLDALRHPDGAAGAASIRGFVWVGLGECTEVDRIEFSELPLPACVNSAREHVYADVVANSANDPDPETLWSAPAMPVADALHLYYTSGTTGRPKGVVLTHRNMLCHARRCVATIGYCQNDIWGHIAPMFHLVDSQAIYFVTQVAARHVFLRSFKPVEVMRAIQQEKITTTNIASTMVAVLMSNPRRPEFDLSSIRILSCGGSALSMAIVEAVIQELKCVFFMDYGMTECSGHICISLLSAELQALPLEQRLLLNSMSGRPFQGMDVRVVAPGQSDSTIPSDGETVGEVVVRGDTVFSGYWRNQAATKESRLAASDSGPDWFRTGDLAVVNDRGFVNVISRLKDMIVSGGENIYATEVENAISAHPKVTMVAVVGVPDELLGERVKAFVTCASQATDPDELWRPLDFDELCDFLRGKLADYKIPSLLEVVDSFPMTTSGKIRKNVLREQCTALLPGQTKSDTEEGCPSILEKILEVARAVFRCRHLVAETPFIDAGMSSVLALRMREQLETTLGLSLPPTLCYDYPCATRLYAFVLSTQGSVQPSPTAREAALDQHQVELGIVGAAVNFPGESSSLYTLWECLKSGRDLNQPIPIDRFDVCEYFESERGGDGYATYVSTGYFTDGARSFDNEFFGISTAEASQMDPQQRMALTTAYTALDDAGLTREALLGSSTGVYVGMLSNDVTTDFKAICTCTNKSWPLAFSLSGIENSVAAGRVSYCLGLRGPAVCVNTACSSSVVALDNAVMALTLDRIVQAVVIGVSVMISPLGFVLTCKAGMLSPDGRCKTFDAGADGFARGEGCGAVVVKRSTPVDKLHALLRGVGVNQDGRSAGLTAPSGPAQVDVVRAALSAADLAAQDISFIEAHGTGTPLGDPIETSALGKVMEGNQREVILGAVKTVLGHCEAAAGMAGLLKTMLVLKHRTAPGNLHLHELNPLIDFPGTFKPIFPTREEVLRSPTHESCTAGVSSFGFSGTNGHILVQSVTGDRCRKPFRNRVAFLCTGQGSQYVQMGQVYMDSEPVFRDAMKQCDRILSGVMDKGLLDVIYDASADPDLINKTQYAQPSLFALEYSLAELWRSRGVVPDVVMGHSLGEYVAACLSGQMSLESALILVAKRAKLMSALPTSGAMAAVFHSEEDVQAALTSLQLGNQVCIACINGPKSCVISGTTDAVEQVREYIGGATTALAVSHAFHSPLMMPMIAEFAALLESVDMNGHSETIEAVRFISNMRGADAVATPQHWVDHVTAPVDFLSGVKMLVAAGCKTMVELGPTPTLVKMAQRCLENSKELTWVSSMTSECSSVSFSAAVATVFESDRHQLNDVAFPWHSGGAVEHPILQRKTQMAKCPARASGIQGTCFAGSIVEATMDSLNQHVIDGAAIMPAAAMLESVATAIQHVYGSTAAVRLFDVVLREALLLEERARVCVSLDSSQTCLSSHAYRDDAEEVVHMTSAFETGGTSRHAKTDVKAMFAGLVETDVDEFYAQAAAIGLSYEEDFKGIEALWVSGATASESESHQPSVGLGSSLRNQHIGRARDPYKEHNPRVVVGKLRPGCQSTAWRQCSWDPTVLDALFQLNIAFSPCEALIPSAIGQIDFLEPLHCAQSNVLYGRATLRHVSRGVQVSDLALMDATGTVLVSVQNFEARQPRLMVKSALERCMWSVTWETVQQRDAEEIVEAATAPSSSLLVLSQGSADSSHFLDNARTRDLSTADAELLLQGWAICVVIVETAEATHELALLAVMRFINLANEINFSGTLWIVTQGAQRVGVEDSAPKLAGIWGLVRTARIEMPHLRLGCLDTSRHSSSALCRWQILQDPTIEPEVSIYDDGDGSVRRVRRLTQVTIQPQNEVCFDSERTFIVTGGLSGFGLRTAVWMCQRGARHLALLSRSGAVSDSDAAGMADWQRLQSLPEVDLCVIACDVANAAAVATALQEIKSKGMPSLGGVIHAAGVLSDAMLHQQTPETVRAVYGPKVDGAYNLHEATAGCEPALDIFAVFSSVAGVLGSAAQANYAAANSCVDAFVAWRRSLGFPACSLAWGPVAEVGMAARHGTAKRVHAQGLEELSMATAFEALERGLELGSSSGRPDGLMGPDFCNPSMLVVPAKWDRWIDRNPSFEPFLRLVAPKPFARAPAELRDSEGSQAIGKSAQPVDVRGEVVALIGTLIGPAAASQLRDGSVLLRCGLDSLSMMELRQALSRRFDVALPPNFLEEHPTLVELVSLLQGIPEMFSSDCSAHVTANPPCSAPVLAAQLCHIWDASIGAEVALAAAEFFNGVAPRRFGPLAPPQSSLQTTVVVIGWAGASPEALSPIVAWHRGQGFHVLRLIPALGGELDADCYAALDALAQEPDVLSGRCFLHCFSNNSIFFLRRMLSDRPQPFERPRMLPLRGLIIDSAPDACEDAGAVDTSGPIALKAHLAASLSISSTTQHPQRPEEFGLLEAVAHAHWKHRRLDVLSSTLGCVVLPGGAPRLCIYGSIDSVVQSTAVKSWIDEERRRGEDVEALEMHSGHVMHHLAHASKYWAAVSRFVAQS